MYLIHLFTLSAEMIKNTKPMTQKLMTAFPTKMLQQKHIYQIPSMWVQIPYMFSQRFTAYILALVRLRQKDCHAFKTLKQSETPPPPPHKAMGTTVNTELNARFPADAVAPYVTSSSPRPVWRDPAPCPKFFKKSTLFKSRKNTTNQGL